MPYSWDSFLFRLRLPFEIASKPGSLAQMNFKPLAIEIPRGFVLLPERRLAGFRPVKFCIAIYFNLKLRQLTIANLRLAAA